MFQKRLGLMLALVASGCVQRQLTVVSEPSGALVYLNNQEVGRTPLTRDFVWYGDYDVQLRREGYETLKTHTWITAPWWQWPPIDFAAEALPLTDHEYVGFLMKPASERPADSAEMLARGAEMRGQLQSSKYTRKPGAPATAPAP